MNVKVPGLQRLAVYKSFWSG